MTKKFLTSVADVYAYDEDDNLLFQGKTLLDSSIETSLSNSEIRGGRGNQLQGIYYHTATMNVNITDAQWNLDFLANTVGDSIATGNNVYAEETVTLGVAGAGTVTGTPLAIQGAVLYGWIKHDGVDVIERVTFTGQAFTSSVGAENDIVCIRFYELNSAARSVNINANVIPANVRLVLEAQLNSSDASTNVIGSIQIIVPKASLSGSFTISMTPDGVASTPISAMALASEALATGACSDVPVYAKIIEIITNANWYDNVVALAIEGGDFSLASGESKLLVVYAVPSTGAPFIPPVADLTFASDSPADATVSVAGLVEWVQAAGTPVIKASITANTDIDANVIVTTT